MQNHTILTRECVLKMLKAARKKGKSDRARDLVCGTRVFNAFGGCTCICWIAAKLPLRERGLELGSPVGFFWDEELSYFGAHLGAM